METKKFKPGMIYKDRILITCAFCDEVEYFDLEEARKFRTKSEILYALLRDCEPVSCKDVFFQKLQMNDID